MLSGFMSDGDTTMPDLEHTLPRQTPGLTHAYTSPESNLATPIHCQTSCLTCHMQLLYCCVLCWVACCVAFDLYFPISYHSDTHVHKGCTAHAYTRNRLTDSLREGMLPARWIVHWRQPILQTVFHRMDATPSSTEGMYGTTWSLNTACR